MSALPPRAVLERMSRKELQETCRNHGVKANLKSKVIIDLLVGVDVPRPRAVAQSRTSSRSSSRTRARTGSIVIHDSDQEDKRSDKGLIVGPSCAQESVISLPRSHKSKDMQTRLGKGRPLAAGSAGSKVITKPPLQSQRTSRSVQQSQSTILEESEIAEGPVTDGKLVAQLTDSSAEQSAMPSNNLHQRSPSIQKTLSTEDLDQRVAETIRPLQEQMKYMMSQLEQMRTLRAEVERLKTRMDAVDSLQQRIQDLSLEIDGLREQGSAAADLNAEVTRLKNIVKELESRPGFPLTPQFTSTPHNHNKSLPGSIAAGPELSSMQLSPRAGIGKRPNDLTEEQQVHELAPGPVKKRARISQLDTLPRTPANQITHPGDGSDSGGGPRIHTPHALARFRVYTDIEAGDNMGSQSNAHLPTVNVPISPTQPRVPRGVSMEPFNFTFMPPPTPVLPAALHNLPIPRPPSSPTPMTSDRESGPLRQSRGGSTGQTGIFGPLGISAQARQRSRPASSTTGPYVNPAALRRAHGVREGLISGSEAAATFGLQRIGDDDASEDTSPLRSTIYGTELERDHRFGDFGVEGVATGFYIGGRPRF